MTSSAWSEAIGDKAIQRVAETKLGRFWVSTVWLGLDHRFGNGDPLIFETMAFPCDADGMVTSWGDVESDRYSTEDEARAGHEVIVAKLKALEENTAVNAGATPSAVGATESA